MIEQSKLDFFGKHTYVLDDKGRISIPPQFRYALKPDTSLQSENVVLTRGLDGCVFGFPVSVWHTYMDRVPHIGLSGDQYLRFVRRLYASAATVSVDQQGRIKIPQHLIEHASLDKDIYIIGMKNRFEIWDAAKYNEYDKLIDAKEEFNEKGAEMELFVSMEREKPLASQESELLPAPHDAALTG